MEGQKCIDVVIPAYYPGSRLAGILDMLERQRTQIRAIRLINTEEAGWKAFLADQSADEASFLAVHPKLTVEHIRQADFDHGSVRNRGWRACTGADYCLCMTQDALPEGEDLVTNLLEGFQREDCAVCYARQLPNPGEEYAEVVTRQINYPEVSAYKCAADRERLGIRTYYCSDVCAVYRRDVLEELGGFNEPMIFNEDMVFAARAMEKGYCVYYAAKARVFHSHHYTAAKQFGRNFDLGVSQAQHPEGFAGLHSEGTGVGYAKAVLAALLKRGQVGASFVFAARCAARLLGYRLGKAYEKLPAGLVRRLSASPWYWDLRQGETNGTEGRG